MSNQAPIHNLRKVHQWPRSRSARRSPRRGIGAIRAIERLEDRTLLSAGGLDTSFGTNGIVTTDFGQPAPANITALAVQSTARS